MGLTVATEAAELEVGQLEQAEDVEPEFLEQGGRREQASLDEILDGLRSHAGELEEPAGGGEMIVGKARALVAWAELETDRVVQSHPHFIRVNKARRWSARGQRAHAPDPGRSMGCEVHLNWHPLHPPPPVQAS